MQSQITAQIQITDTWQNIFQTYLRNEYRHVNASHRAPSEKTIKAAMQHIRAFSLWWEATNQESFEPSKITNIDFHAWRHQSLEEARVAPQTWNSRLWALGIFCNWIESILGTSYSNLLDGIEIKKQGIRPARYRSLTDQEYHALIRILERRTREAITVFEQYTAVRNRAIVSIMLFCGLRVEEVSHLETSELTINPRSGELRVRNGKGDKERVLSIGLICRGALGDWVNIRENTTTKDLFGLSVRQIERVVSDLGAACKIPGLSPHWLRYHFGKMLQKQGAPIERIGELYGHSSVETTKRYLRSGMDEYQAAVEYLGL